MSTFNINQAVVGGNITKDPELKKTTNGVSYCMFGLATNKSIKKEDGSYEDQVTFHNIKFWGKMAESIAKNFGKGNKVTISGEISNRVYDDKDGNKKNFSEIVGRCIVGMGKPKDQNIQDAEDVFAEAEEKEKKKEDEEDIIA